MGEGYSIILKDGTVIDNLILNGNNFIAKEDIGKDIFENNLKNVEIKGPMDDFGLVGKHKQLELIYRGLDEGLGGYCFILYEPDPAVLRERAREEEITQLQMALAEMYEKLTRG